MRWVETSLDVVDNCPTTYARDKYSTQATTAAPIIALDTGIHQYSILENKNLTTIHTAYIAGGVIFEQAGQFARATTICL